MANFFTKLADLIDGQPKETTAAEVAKPVAEEKPVAPAPQPESQPAPEPTPQVKPEPAPEPVPQPAPEPEQPRIERPQLTIESDEAGYRLEMLTRLQKKLDRDAILATKDLTLLFYRAKDLQLATEHNWKEEIQNFFTIEWGASFAEISMRQASVEEWTEQEHMMDNIIVMLSEHVQIVPPQGTAPAQVYEATISIFCGQGSLEQDEYIISSQDLNNSHHVFNIGRSSRCDVSGGIRINDIAIRAEQDDPAYEYNKFVSRTHAHIGCSKKAGFYLQAEPAGCRVLGNRTRILRQQQVIDLATPDSIIRLQNGDVIELGKAVKLLVKLLY